MFVRHTLNLMLKWLSVGKVHTFENFWKMFLLAISKYINRFVCLSDVWWCLSIPSQNRCKRAFPFRIAVKGRWPSKIDVKGCWLRFGWGTWVIHDWWFNTHSGFMMLHNDYVLDLYDLCRSRIVSFWKWLEIQMILKINFLTTGARLIKLIEMIINWLFQLVN